MLRLAGGPLEVAFVGPMGEGLDRHVGVGPTQPGRAAGQPERAVAPFAQQVDELVVGDAVHRIRPPRKRHRSSTMRSGPMAVSHTTTQVLMKWK